VSTTQTTITDDMTPAEAANLLVKLEEGDQAAWLSTRELSWRSPEYESRFQNAAEIDGLFRDVLRETLDNGMRHPGEPVDEFAERAGSDAWLADARTADAETTRDPIIQKADAGITPEHVGKGRDEAAARPLNDASSPQARPTPGRCPMLPRPAHGSCGDETRSQNPTAHRALLIPIRFSLAAAGT
jgi:hypothetical protein